MLIEYRATPRQDGLLEKAFAPYFIMEWFNPSEDYYVLETEDPRVVQTLNLMNIVYQITESANKTT